MQRKHDTEPFPFIGEKIFDAGSKFWLNIQTTEPGALYVFSEGKNEKDLTEWNTMFPTRANNKGDAWLAADPARTFRTKGYIFDDRRGTIRIWVFWATGSGLNYSKKLSRRLMKLMALLPNQQPCRLSLNDTSRVEQRYCPTKRSFGSR